MRVLIRNSFGTNTAQHGAKLPPLPAGPLVDAITPESLGFFSSLDLAAGDFNHLEGASIRHIPHSAKAAVNAVFKAAGSRVEANLSDLNAWKFLIAVPRMILAPTQPTSTEVTSGEQIVSRCHQVLAGDFRGAWFAYDCDRPKALRGNSAEDGVELAIYIEECVGDKDLGRAVRRVVSTGVCPSTLETAELINAKCPQGDFDFTDRASFLNAGTLGSAAARPTPRKPPPSSRSGRALSARAPAAPLRVATVGAMSITSYGSRATPPLPLSSKPSPLTKRRPRSAPSLLLGACWPS